VVPGSGKSEYPNGYVLTRRHAPGLTPIIAVKTDTAWLRSRFKVALISSFTRRSCRGASPPRRRPAILAHTARGRS